MISVFIARWFLSRTSRKTAYEHLEILVEARAEWPDGLHGGVWRFCPHRGSCCRRASGPRALQKSHSHAVCAGSRVSQNECKSGVTSVVFSPGSKTDKPYIKVSNTAATTKVIVLAN